MAADLSRPNALRPSTFSATVVVRRACRVWITTLHHLLIVGAVFLAPIVVVGLLAKSHIERDDLPGIAGLSMVLFAFPLQGAVVSLVFQKLLGQRPQVLASIAAGFKRFLSVLGIALMIGLLSMAVLFGSSLLVTSSGPILAPLVMIGDTVVLVAAALAWCVAIPAAVVERLSPSGALRRSMRLTKGSRLRILGALLLLGAISYALEALVLVPLAAMTRGEIAVTSSIFAALMLTGSFMSVWPAVLYHELRETKEGVGLEQLASVFQ